MLDKIKFEYVLGVLVYLSMMVFFLMGDVEMKTRIVEVVVICFSNICTFFFTKHQVTQGNKNV